MRNTLVACSYLLISSFVSTSDGLSVSIDNNKSANANGKIERPRIPVIEYQNDWVAVNKPAGLTVHRSAGTPRRKFVLSTLLKRQLARKVFPVHRLDHRTSGAILFAFDSKTCGRLHKSLTSSDATKQYVALLRGELEMNPGETVTVDKALSVDGVEKDARTDFILLASVAGSDDQRGDIESRPDFTPACSLVLVQPKSGRTHQIRRHAYALGHPVLGDTEHGDSRVNRWWRTNRSLNRLALHCFSLDLPPIERSEDEIGMSETNGGDNRVKCVAPLPAEFSSVLRGGGMEKIWEEAIKKEPRLMLEPFDVRGGSFGRNYKREKS